MAAKMLYSTNKDMLTDMVSYLNIADVGVYRKIDKLIVSKS